MYVRTIYAERKRKNYFFFLLLRSSYTMSLLHLFSLLALVDNFSSSLDRVVVIRCSDEMWTKATSHIVTCISQY